MLVVVAVAFLLGGSRAGSASSTITGPNYIQAHSINLITSPTMNTNTLSVNYLRPFSGTPMIVMGMYRWSQTGQSIVSYRAKVLDRGTSAFNVSYTVDANCTIQLQNYWWMGVDANASANYFLLPNINYMGDYANVSSGVQTVRRCSQLSINFVSELSDQPNTSPAADAGLGAADSSLQLVVFLQGVSLEAIVDIIEVSISGSCISATTYQFKVCTQASFITSVYYGRFIFNLTALKSVSGTYVDYGQAYTGSSSWSGWTLSYASYNHEWFIMGLTGFTLFSANTMDFLYDAPLSLTASGNMNFSNMLMNHWYMYNVACSGIYIYFNPTDGMCYDTCPAGFYPQMSTSMCMACSALCAECSGTTSNCTACNSSVQFRMLNATSSTCVCMAGYIDTGSNICEPCTNYLGSCTACTSTTVCTACNTTNGFLLNGTNCTCNTTSYNSSGTCRLCSADISNCQTCTSGSVCTFCNESTLSLAVGGSCQCITNTNPNGFNNPCNCPGGFVTATMYCGCPAQYYQSGNNCYACDPTCYNCTGSTASQCTSCPPGPTYLSSGSCICGPGYYQHGVPIMCDACHYSCADCSQLLQTDCRSCDASLHRTFNGSACPCDTNYIDVGVALCEAVLCQAGYYIDASGQCADICGDGLVLMLPCDDGNTISGDGCSSECAIEANYTCNFGTATSPSICSYNQPITMQVIDQIKSITDNTMDVTLQLLPPLKNFDGLNFSTVISTNLSGTTLSFTYLGNGVVVAHMAYTQNLQNLTALLTFDPAANQQFFAAPASSSIMFVSPNNNVPATYQDPVMFSSLSAVQTLAMVVAGLALAGLLVALYMGSFIGIEAIGVVQVTFLGLMLLDMMHPLLASLTGLSISNGINSAYTQNRTQFVGNSLPARYQPLGFGGDFAYSWNYMLGLLLLPFVVALVLFVASRIAKSRSEQLVRYAWITLCEHGFSTVLFLMYNTTAAIAILAVYSPGTNSPLFAMNLAQIALLAIGITLVLVLFKRKPEYFGDYKTAFKQDTLSQSHYWIIVGGRLLIVIVLVFASATAYGGLIGLLFPLALGIYVTVRRPYNITYNNIRAGINNLVEVLVLAIYGYYRMATDFTNQISSFNNMLPYVVLALLLLCVIGNIGILIKYWLDKRKLQNQIADKAKADALALLSAQQQEKFMQEMNRRKLNEIANASYLARSRMGDESQFMGMDESIGFLNASKSALQENDNYSFNDRHRRHHDGGSGPTSDKEEDSPILDKSINKEGRQKSMNAAKTTLEPFRLRLNPKVSASQQRKLNKRGLRQETSAISYAQIRKLKPTSKADPPVKIRPSFNGMSGQQSFEINAEEATINVKREVSMAVDTKHLLKINKITTTLDASLLTEMPKYLDEGVSNYNEHERSQIHQGFDAI